MDSDSLQSVDLAVSLGRPGGVPDYKELTINKVFIISLYPFINDSYIVLYNDVGVKTINKFDPLSYSTLKNSYFVVHRWDFGYI